MDKPQWMRLLVLPVLWMMTAMMRVTKATSGSSLSSVPTPHIEIYHGYMIAQHLTTGVLLQDVSIGFCRSLCLIQRSCRAFTIQRVGEKGLVNCSFTVYLHRIGHLTEEPNSHTFIVGYEGPWECKAPFDQVPGVGCVHLIRRERSYSDRLDDCKDLGAYVFEADTPDHLRRLYENYVAVMGEQVYNIIMGALLEYWRITRRLVSHSEIDPNHSYDEHDPLYIMNLDNGLLQRVDVDKGPFLCEKKFPGLD